MFYSRIAIILGGFSLLGCHARLERATPAAEKGPAYPAEALNLKDQAALAKGDQSPFYVEMSGWNSCKEDARIPGQASPYGMNAFTEFSKFIQRIEQQSQGRKAKYLISCHTTDIDKVRYIFSDDPTNLHIKSHELMFDEIVRYAKAQNSPIVTIGHSYGGSYAMQFIMSAPADARLSRLITIDPISPTYCPPEVMFDLLETRIDQLLGGKSANTGLGCQEAPRDFSDADKQYIRSRVSTWENYYQSDLLSILRSTFIPEACNQPVQHHSLANMLNGHIAMGFYDSLWNDIFDRVVNPPPPTCVTRSI